MDLRGEKGLGDNHIFTSLNKKRLRKSLATPGMDVLADGPACSVNH